MKNGVYWDVKITDNTNSNALYVGQGALFDVTVGKVTRDFHFASGWDGSRYGEARAAAPFQPSAHATTPKVALCLQL